MLEINTPHKEFHLQTRSSSYIMRVGPAGHLEQVYYGRKIRHQPSFSGLVQQFTSPISSSTSYNSDFPAYVLETTCLELGVNGKGDYREPSLHLQHMDDGTRVSDFIYDSHEVLDHKFTVPGMPHGIDPKEQVKTLAITLKDSLKPVKVVLYYSAFYDCDTITRSMEIINDADHDLSIEKAHSFNFDVVDSDYELISLEGAWIREAQINRRPLSKGMTVIDSKKGVSGANHNPFLSLVRPDATENRGDCYGFGLIYSGNHQCSVEVSTHDLTRVQMGINAFDFQWTLARGESFHTPEVVMTFSNEGLNRMSHNFHDFINGHLISPNWQRRPKPVQVNNWEATYFDFDEAKLLKLAKKAKKLGVELFVLDDGWFGSRNSDNCSLGDYFDDKQKLPGGLAQVSKKIRALGLDFGIWVEPEMISEDSELVSQTPGVGANLPWSQAICWPTAAGTGYG